MTSTNSSSRRRCRSRLSLGIVLGLSAGCTLLTFHSSLDLRAAPAADAVGRGRVAPDDEIRIGHARADGSFRVAALAMDEYIAQVLAGEGQPDAGDAAQQALAVTARTFAQANRQRHGRDGFDLCDTTHCQVVKPATTPTRRAAVATSGQVLLRDGKPAPVFYSASCGGRIERASQVWPGAIDLSQPEHDEADASEPAWLSEIRGVDVERALRAAGRRGGRLRNLRVIQRNGSGRVVRLRADGFTPPEISGNDFRLAVGRVGGWQLVKSTAFDVTRTGSVYRFRGRGFGHGVGLCVVGAGLRSARGATADAILRFYFPTLSLGRLTPGALRADAAPAAGASVAPALAAVEGTTVPFAEGAAAASAAPVPLAPAPAAPAPPAPRDIQIVLPLSDEGSRQLLLALARRARDATAAASGQKAPPALRITVHPSLESFGRATGQPWWVAGATSGTEIALLPVGLLRQQGQLERAVRHEVAHALLDVVLAGRPVWVREGAAIHFSRPSEELGATLHAENGRRSSGRTICPSDAELLRPVSAGAQRDAYARAEACFVRQLNAGRKWSEVR